MHKTIVIIPTYNERENIVALAHAIFSLYEDVSVLVVDDGSPDGTGNAVRDMYDTYPNLRLLERTGERGFGRSYLDAFRMINGDSRYDMVVMMDADHSHEPHAVASLVAGLRTHDAVIGSRYCPGGNIRNWALHRRILSRGANIYVRTLLGVPVRDMTTGFMCFKKELLDLVDFAGINSDGYAFLVELKYRLHKAGARMAEAPITFTERREGESKMSSKVIWESIWLPWKLRLSKI